MRMTAQKLRCGENWHGVLKQKGKKQTGVNKSWV